MRAFTSEQVPEAIQHSLDGGQALHVWDGHAKWPTDGVPAPFKRHRWWGHLLDQDAARLVRTARRLGVRRIVVGQRGERGQHVDLCGRPLERARAECRS